MENEKDKSSFEEIEKNRKALLEKVKTINGKTIGEIDQYGLLNNAKNKGDIGQVIQKFLGKDLDNNPNLDFPEAELELKVTGLLPNKTKKKEKFRAKERLVLTIINYNEDYKDSFENSHLIEKCNDMLMTCYEYLEPKNGEKVDYRTFPIIDSFILSLSDGDKAMMERDYNFIISKIKEGKADQISESDTNYLAACTKGKDSSVRTSQPFSSSLAKPRAFSLKQSFVSSLIREYISDEHFQSILEGMNEIGVGLEDFVLSKLKPWFGKTEEELGYAFNVATNAKNRYSMYINRIFKVSSLEESEEFQKADIVVKTMRIQKTGFIKENMSFAQMDFFDVANTPWEESSVRAYFTEKRFLFIAFKETKKGYVLDSAAFYNFPESIVDEFIGYTYRKTQKILLEGNIVQSTTWQNIKGKKKLIHKTNFVGQKENPICHVRPHGIDFNDQLPLPVIDKYTGYANYEKQCFWIDTRFINAILHGRENDYLNIAREKLKLKSNAVLENKNCK
ncbi:MAG: Sau3AI family type II restriction endonuclease [Bacilli bacterium]|nr:Sau3AI family type II restriction endonuclease [Bacilli bacterium]